MAAMERQSKYIWRCQSSFNDESSCFLRTPSGILWSTSCSNEVEKRPWLALHFRQEVLWGRNRLATMLGNFPITSLDPSVIDTHLPLVFCPSQAIEWVLFKLTGILLSTWELPENAAGLTLFCRLSHSQKPCWGKPTCQFYCSCWMREINWKITPQTNV